MFRRLKELAKKTTDAGLEPATLALREQVGGPRATIAPTGQS